MREIKFRAWNDKSKEMFDVDVLAINPVMWDSGGTGVSLAYQPHIKIMQYTGLKDKNGRGIYEGDILEYEDFSYRAFINAPQPKRRDVIKWDDSENCSNGYKIYGKGFEFKGEDVEIIGNIYENPELLEESK